MMHREINCEKIPKHSRWCHDVLEGVDIKTYGVNIARGGELMLKANISIYKRYMEISQGLHGYIDQIRWDSVEIGYM